MTVRFRLAGSACPERDASPDDRRATAGQRGQVIVIFAGAIVLFTMLLAIVIDVSWYWANSLRVQRAADAAALAGAVYLPGDVTTAYSRARAEARKNGYVNGTNATVTPVQDAMNNRQLNVSMSAPVGTFFMRVIGISSIQATRTAKAEYVLPVPMGSPLNYYGVYQLCKKDGTCASIPAASGGGNLASQGFFGAIEGQGSNRSTGDAFAPYYNGKPTTNSQYDSEGYSYTVQVNAAGSSVSIFDPTFCATTTSSGGGHLGAGDHWLGPSNPGPVSTYFRLWDTKETPYTTIDDTLVASSGSLFTNENQEDKSSEYGNTTNSGYADQGTPSGYIDCAAGKITDTSQGGYWHNKWWTLASGLAPGTYRVQVTPTDPGYPLGNLGQSFENMFSLEVDGGGDPQVFGSGRMVTYANIESGSQLFYLAQIDRPTAAGKTIEIDLFDPGDVGDKAWIQILSPDGNVYTPATFKYSADNGRSGTNRTCIQTFANSGSISPPSGCTENASSGGTLYNNSWVTIQIPLPDSYGSTGLTPPGEPAAGWWKIKYTVNKGNDTTTWMVNIRGNPVHLKVP